MPHYYMFHKPFGCVTARRDDRYPTVMDYFKELHNDRLSPVGRLDRETTGLLLITDDGILTRSSLILPITKRKLMNSPFLVI